MKLNQLKPGQSAIIDEVKGEGALRQHLLDMGMIPGEKVTLIKLAPMGDPIEVMIHDYELTLRLADAANIVVEKVQTVQDEKKETAEPKRPVAHPGLGEEGKFHPKGTGNPLPEGTVLTFALVGNQNCGKTTLFNQLTGSNQHVGNFPGVTVDRKDGVIKGYPDTLITDLPGIYSMSPYSSEELVSRDFVLKQRPKAIINIVDATNIERNLYLTMQLLEMGIPMVIALNMMDEVRGNGGTIMVNAMEAMLGVPVVPISASKNEGVDELMRHAYHVYPHTFYNEFFRCTFGVPTFKRIDNYTKEMKEIIWEYHYYLHQYVGPFFYINGAIKAAKTDVIKGNINDDFINGPISHFDYFQTLGIDDDYGHYPRGRVIYNNKTNEFIIYLDKSLINKKEVIEQIMYLYRLKNQNTLVKTDEHYAHDNL